MSSGYGCDPSLLCLLSLTAVKLETLRLNPPVGAISKYTAEHAQQLNIRGCIYTIPPRTVIFPNMIALHTNPAVWGEDATTFRPSRWILNTRASDPMWSIAGNEDRFIPSSLHEEILADPPRGAYFPWSSGAHVCLGRKFAQVEFVAVLACLFGSHSVQPVLKSRETLPQARERFLRKLDERIFKMTMQIKNSRALVVEWTRRGSPTAANE